MQPEHPLSDQVICFSTELFASMVWMCTSSFNRSSRQSPT